MHISDDLLIAYLLGDASKDDCDAIERELRSDESLIARLSHLRFVIGQVDSLGSGVYEPPGDLVASTLQRIENFSGDDLLELGDRPGTVRRRAWLSPSNEFDGGSKRAFLDSLVLTVCLAIICCMVLPTIVSVRFSSRKFLCAENLRGIGFKSFDFAINEPSGRLPSVDTHGPTAFAGIYVVRLNDAGRRVNFSDVQCPSLPGVADAEAELLDSDTRAIDTADVDLQDTELPTAADLNRMSPLKLARAQRRAGGTYAYGLGVLEDGRVVAPKYAGRSHFAVLADAPIFVEDEERFLAHDGRGANILFEDGRVVFVRVLEGQRLDNPFRNLIGKHAYGLNDTDASLAPSHYSPLGRALPLEIDSSDLH